MPWFRGSVRPDCAAPAADNPLCDIVTRGSNARVFALCGNDPSSYKQFSFFLKGVTLRLRPCSCVAAKRRIDKPAETLGETHQGVAVTPVGVKERACAEGWEVLGGRNMVKGLFTEA